MTEHIDNRRLNEDLRYRFEYISKFINFTNDDITALNTLATIILPLIPVIVDAVYRKLFQFDITKHFFVLHNDGFDGPLEKDEALTLDSAQMIYRQDMLSDYLKRLLLQHEWTDGFLEYLSQVGRIHTNKTESPSSNIDLIHINATFCYTENLIIDTVWTLENLDNKTKKSIVIALNKVFKIQNDFFLLHYLKSTKENDLSTSSTHKTDKCVCS